MINLNDGNIERFRLICFYMKFISKGTRIFTAASQVKINKKSRRRRDGLRLCTRAEAASPFP